MSTAIRQVSSQPANAEAAARHRTVGRTITAEENELSAMQHFLGNQVVQRSQAGRGSSGCAPQTPGTDGLEQSVSSENDGPDREAIAPPPEATRVTQSDTLPQKRPASSAPSRVSRETTSQECHECEQGSPEETEDAVEAESDEAERQFDRVTGTPSGEPPEKPVVPPQSTLTSRPAYGGAGQISRRRPGADSVTASGRANAKPGILPPIVEDDARIVSPSQMTRTRFLSEVESSVRKAVDERLSATGMTSTDCPYLDFWFSYYHGKDVEHLERATVKYAPEAVFAESAEEVIAAVVNRARRGVEAWLAAGHGMTVLGDGCAGARGVSPQDSAGLLSSAPEFRALDAGLAEIDDPRAIQSQLNSGQRLDGAVRSGMEAAFGSDFSAVRVHTDSNAAALSDKLNARAFTVGSDIAFGAGEYRPGDPIGDALLAHELAHVVQQRHASSGGENGGSGPADSSLEDDADATALSAVASIWGSPATPSIEGSGEIDSTKDRSQERQVGPAGGVAGSRWTSCIETLRSMSHRTTPALKSRLRLSRCHRDAQPPAQQGASGGAGTTTIGEVNAPNTPLGVKRIPPRVDTSVPVGISGSGAVTLSIEGGSEENGTATINGSATHALTSNETVKLRGVSQTGPGHAGGLKLVASAGSNRLAESNPFSVAAYPVSVGFRFNRVVVAEPSPSTPGLKSWGAAYDLTFTSDSGTTPEAMSDCDKTKLGEKILPGVRTGAFATTEMKSSGFNRTTSTQTDYHALPATNAAELERPLAQIKDLSQSKGEYNQFFTFSCERTGIKEDLTGGPKIPTSGFKITFTLKEGDAFDFLQVQKQGFANNDVAAGVVNDQRVKDVPMKD